MANHPLNILIKKINIFNQTFSVVELLQRLGTLTEVLWLNNKEAPFFGLQPMLTVHPAPCRTKPLPASRSSDVIFRKECSLDFTELPATNLLPEKKVLHFFNQINWQHDYTEMTGFNGGIVAFVSYDYAQHRVLSPDSFTQQPLAALPYSLGIYDCFIRQDDHGHWALYGPEHPSLIDFYEAVDTLLNGSQPAPQPLPPSEMKQPPYLVDRLQPVWTRVHYQHAFRRVQRYLVEGDCYQVNLTQAFRGTVSGSILPWADQLLSVSPAPYAAYFNQLDTELISCSPELFIEFYADGTVSTRPIKGTLRRYPSDPAKDFEARQALQHSEKDRSENLMIVDLLRNDLGQHAIAGSVSVPELFTVESYAQVHHLVSEVRATLKAGLHPLEMLMSALPGGSITGAPKRRAMEIIQELESGPRGAYCGTIGYLNADGSGRFNILIRTLERTGDQLSLWAGGGITVASREEQEYQECLDKVGALLAAVNQFADE